MITIERTRDMTLVRALMTHPRLYEKMTDDTCPSRKTFKPIDHDHLHYLVPKCDERPMGSLLFNPATFYLYQIHIGILPEFWGQGIEKVVALALDYMKAHTQCLHVIAMIPDYNRHAHQLAIRCGFTIEGCLKASTRIKNRIFDQTILGINL